jgi:ubiquitin-protein ligase
MSTVRLRRLTADYTRLTEYTKSHPRLKLIQTDGDPPERYHIEYRIRSLRQVDGEMRVIKSHTVEILLPRNYPRTPPQCRMLTPVFHPNIAPHAICVGDHWSPGESLESLVCRIGEMLAYQSYNVKSPLNGEAARWVAEHEDELPLDPVSMILDESRLADSISPATPPVPPDSSKLNDAISSNRTRSAGRPTAPADSGFDSKAAAEDSDVKPTTLIARCPSCSRKYRVPVTAAGRKANCSECATMFHIPSLSEPF